MFENSANSRSHQLKGASPTKRLLCLNNFHLMLRRRWFGRVRKEARHSSPAIANWFVRTVQRDRVVEARLSYEQCFKISASDGKAHTIGTASITEHSIQIPILIRRFHSNLIFY